MKNCNTLGSKTPKNDILTLNKAFPVASTRRAVEGLLNAVKGFY